MKRVIAAASVAAVLVVAAACGRNGETARPRASGYVEATEVRVAPEVGGRLIELKVDEGTRVAVGDIIGRLETADAELALRRAEADRDQVLAQLRLAQAGARPQEIRRAQAQVDSAKADTRAAEAELASAEADLQRFEGLLKVNAGSRKQRDDAATRRDVANAQVFAARAAYQRCGRKPGDAARRLARRGDRRGPCPRRGGGGADRVAAEERRRRSAHVPGRRRRHREARRRRRDDAPRAPIVVVTDLDRAWANVYVGEPAVPRLKLGQKVAPSSPMPAIEWKARSRSSRRRRSSRRATSRPPRSARGSSTA